MKLKTADKIQKDYGKIPLELAGKNAELDPIDRVRKYLSKQHKNDLITMVQTFAQLDRKAS